MGEAYVHHVCVYWWLMVIIILRSRSRADEDDINCATCKNRFSLKIFNCSSGHAMCMECKQRRRPCGSCGCGITDRRNITMEEYVYEVSRTIVESKMAKVRSCASLMSHIVHCVTWVHSHLSPKTHFVSHVSFVTYSSSCSIYYIQLLERYPSGDPGGGSGGLVVSVDLGSHREETSIWRRR